jgi:hypothetical protein
MAMPSTEEKFFQRAVTLFHEIGPAIEAASEAGDGAWATKLENFADLTRDHIKSGNFATAASHITFVCNSINEMPVQFQGQVKLCFFDWFWSDLSADEIKRFSKYLAAA